MRRRADTCPVDREEQPQPCCFDEWASHNAAKARKRGIGCRHHAVVARRTREPRPTGKDGVRSGVRYRRSGTRGARSRRRERRRHRPGPAERSSRRSHSPRSAGCPIGRPSRWATAPSIRSQDATWSLSTESCAAIPAWISCSPIHSGPRATSTRTPPRSTRASWDGSTASRSASGTCGIGSGTGSSRGFRAFVHDLDAVDRTIAGAGFRKAHGAHRRVWQLAVFTRA